MVPSRHHHEELVYSTFVTRGLHLTTINESIHNIRSISHPMEQLVFACGYAFNPVMFPLWPALIYGMTYWCLSSPESLIKYDHGIIQSLNTNYKNRPEIGALLNTGLYVVSVVITLVFTEISKRWFASTRPSPPTPEILRRYGRLVASLKSKHSFPSGDVAQAVNLCMFISKHVPVGKPLKILLFGLFVPGVAFARVFYRCHWIEDTVGAMALSYALHKVMIPFIEAVCKISLKPTASVI